MIKFSVTNEVGAKVSVSFFKDVLKKFEKVLSKRIKERLGKRNGDIDLVLTSDETIKAINAEYRGTNKPTDVISFAYLEVTDYKKAKGDIIVGDIFISYDTAKKQAKKNKIRIDEELESLFVHGLLHLFGFDHRTDEEEEEMEEWAKKVIMG